MSLVPLVLAVGSECLAFVPLMVRILTPSRRVMSGREGGGGGGVARGGISVWRAAPGAGGGAGGGSSHARREAPRPQSPEPPGPQGRASRVPRVAAAACVLRRLRPTGGGTIPPEGSRVLTLCCGKRGENMRLSESWREIIVCGGESGRRHVM